MDAPTAYIFPEIYDKVTVVKGPQTVLYPGNGSAATIRFEKEPKKYDKPGYDVHASGLIGSFGRHDEVIDANAGDKGYFVNFAASNSHSQDYKDGNGINLGKHISILFSYITYVIKFFNDIDIIV